MKRFFLLSLLLVGVTTLRAQDTNRDVNTRILQYVAPSIATSTTQPGGKVGLDYMLMVQDEFDNSPLLMGIGLGANLSSFIKPESRWNDNLIAEIDLEGRIGIDTGKTLVQNGGYPEGMGIMVYLNGGFGICRYFALSEWFAKMYFGFGADFTFSPKFTLFVQMDTYLLNPSNSKWSIANCFRGETDPRPFGTDIVIGVRF